MSVFSSNRQSSLGISQRKGAVPDGLLTTSKPTGLEVTPSSSDVLRFSHFPFLNLPSEIRSLIYSMVLDTGETPIQIAHEQYSHHSFHPPEITPSEGCQFCKPPKRPGITRFPISVLLVCSQIHHESHLLPYLLNTFVMYTSTLLGFVHARTPSQLRSLRSISLPGMVLDDGDHLSYSAWMLWEITDGLKSLKKLTLGLLILRGEVTLDGYADGYEGVGIWFNRGMAMPNITDEIIPLLSWTYTEPTRGPAHDEGHSLSAERADGGAIVSE